MILELFQDTGNNKVFPRKAGWSVTVDGESKSLTNREYSDYQREMGQMSYNIAEYLVPKFDNLTDEQKYRYWIMRILWQRMLLKMSCSARI